MPEQPSIQRAGGLDAHSSSPGAFGHAKALCAMHTTQDCHFLTCTWSGSRSRLLGQLTDWLCQIKCFTCARARVMARSAGPTSPWPSV